MKKKVVKKKAESKKKRVTQAEVIEEFMNDLNKKVIDKPAKKKAIAPKRKKKSTEVVQNLFGENVRESVEHLTQQQIYALEQYLITGNQRESGLKAGYSAGKDFASVDTQMSRLLSDAKSQIYLRNRRREMQDQTPVTRERVLQELGRVGFFDVRDLFNHDGTLRQVVDYDSVTGSAVASIEIESLSAGRGTDREEYGRVTKIKTNNKLQALEQIARIMGWNKDSLAVSGSLGMKSTEELEKELDEIKKLKELHKMTENKQ